MFFEACSGGLFHDKFSHQDLYDCYCLVGHVCDVCPFLTRLAFDDKLTSDLSTDGIPSVITMRNQIRETTSVVLPSTLKRMSYTARVTISESSFSFDFDEIGIPSYLQDKSKRLDR